jgi:hypothetical protein
MVHIVGEYPPKPGTDAAPVACQNSECPEYGKPKWVVPASEVGAPQIHCGGCWVGPVEPVPEPRAEPKAAAPKPQPPKAKRGV